MADKRAQRSCLASDLPDKEPLTAKHPSCPRFIYVLKFIHTCPSPHRCRGERSRTRSYRLNFSTIQGGQAEKGAMKSASETNPGRSRGAACPVLVNTFYLYKMVVFHAVVLFYWLCFCSVSNMRGDKYTILLFSINVSQWLPHRWHFYLLPLTGIIGGQNTTVMKTCISAAVIGASMQAKRVKVVSSAFLCKCILDFVKNMNKYNTVIFISFSTYMQLNKLQKQDI